MLYFVIKNCYNEIISVKKFELNLTLLIKALPIRLIMVEFQHNPLLKLRNYRDHSILSELLCLFIFLRIECYTMLLRIFIMKLFQSKNGRSYILLGFDLYIYM
jgi:hypothetical protein